jgi:hypothetical protein
MKCVLCDQRKAKRFCPAETKQICAQCCGQKRVLEIDCPESCVYLKAGREREMQDYVRRLGNMDPAGLEKRRLVLQEHQDALARLEAVLAQERLSDRTLTDKDVVDTITVLLDTYKTEEKGVLYEKTSEDLRIESLRRELKKIIESLRNPEGQEGRGIIDPASTRLQLGAVIDCLDFIRSLAESYMQDRASVSGYLDFLARLFPREEKRNSILLP